MPVTLRLLKVETPVAFIFPSTFPVKLPVKVLLTLLAVSCPTIVKLFPTCKSALKEPSPITSNVVDGRVVPKPNDPPIPVRVINL